MSETEPWFPARGVLAVIGHPRVLVRDPEQTEMLAANDGRAKAFSKQLIRAGKDFSASLNDDGTWTFVVDETNHPSRWENE